MYGGDSRSDRKNRQNVNDFLREQFSADDAILALVHGGDYIESAVVWDQWVAWMEDWMRTTTRQGQLLPIVPGRGNHEFEFGELSERTDTYNAVFGMPGGDERDYWTTEFGAHTAFITLNTNTTLGGDQRAWLESQLIKYRDERRWILANYHRPAYPAVKSPGGAKTHWVPLFEKYNVDLVCESDGHVLKRTVPIRNDEKAEDGIVYVGEGGLGVKQRTPDERWYLEEPGMAMSAHHVQLLSFGPDELGYRALTLDGDVVDQKTFEPRRQVEPVPLDLEAVDVEEPTRLHVELTKGLKAETVDTGDFAFEGELAVSEAAVHDHFDDTVVLTTEALQKGNSYTLTASEMKDLLGHDIEPDASLTFTYGPDEADPTDADTGGEDAGGESDESGSQEVSKDEPSEATTKNGCSVGGTTSPSPAGLALLVIAAVWLRRKRN
jgi:MYXO-CTERM domain-containing protein